MTATYEPGQVAVATIRGVPNVRIFRSGSGWQGPENWIGDSRVTDIRPLVVLDLEDPASHVQALREFAPADSWECLSWLADQIEAQTTPPFVPKFKLGAHVRYAGTSFTSSDDAWGKRRDDKHLGIVVENFGDGEVRVYDTVEHDWWMCDEARLTAVEDGAS